MEHYTMQDIPEDERPYDKCLSMGPASLTDVELLAVCLRTGTRKKNVLQLARSIIELHKTEGIASLVHLTSAELMQTEGIGKVKAVQLLCIGEIAKRITKNQKNQQQILNHPELIADLFYAELRYCKVEQVWMIALDTKNHLLARVMLSQGTVNSSIISPREVYVAAVKYQAVSIVLLHNHPSGDPKPSDEDIQVTTRVRVAGEIMGIALLDHIIIGDNHYFSMKEQGYIK